ncbi:hypothetical protein Anas_10119 [Armadillidium nasatum]|uniref:C2H2-type domain-containing protein n=1 Tax=Armadillidium nasatum TaxID=96803 RepID=A0A5N5SRV9_9CRUS|nr:hypothetical protein Anas_10119 [Armadillidium nasatum]
MKKMEASLFLGVGKKYMNGGACINQSGSSAEFKIDYVENQKRDAKKKKFKEMYWNLNFALHEMKEANIIGESEDLTADNFPATFEVKVSKEEDSPDQMYYSDEESISEEKNDPHQSNAEFKSSNLLSKNCHIKSSVQNQKPISLGSSECGPFNLKFKYTDTSEEVAVKYDNIKCVAKYSSDSKNASCEPPSNCKKILVNMKSNLRKLYKCHEPLCGYFTLDQSNFKKHNLVHSKYKLKEGADFHSAPHKITRPEGRDIIGKEANHVEHNILHCFDGVDGNSLVDKSVQCSLCDFFCFTSVGLKRHYIRYHSNKETQEFIRKFKLL